MNVGTDNHIIHLLASSFILQTSFCGLSIRSSNNSNYCLTICFYVLTNSKYHYDGGGGGGGREGRGGRRRRRRRKRQN
jgi:hypothetical protein